MSEVHEIGPGHVVIPLGIKPKAKPEKAKELEAIGLKWCPKQNRYVAAVPCQHKTEQPNQFEESEITLSTGQKYRAIISKFPEDKGERKVVEIYDPAKGPGEEVPHEIEKLAKQVFESKIRTEELKAKTMFAKLTTPKPVETRPLRWDPVKRAWADDEAESE